MLPHIGAAECLCWDIQIVYLILGLDRLLFIQYQQLMSPLGNRDFSDIHVLKEAQINLMEESVAAQSQRSKVLLSSPS